LGLYLFVVPGFVAQRPDPTMQLMLSQPPVDISSPVVATAVVDPPVVPAGELAIYRITVNALEASVRWPPAPPPVRGLTMRLSASGQTVPLVGNVQRPITARNFHLRAERPGFYTLPAFEIEAYGKRIVVPEAQLEVTVAQRPGFEPARRIYLQLAKTNAFVGETIPVEVLAPGTISNVVSGLSQVQFNGEGMHGSKTPIRQLGEPREFYGRKIATWIYESTITPIAAGSLELSVQGFAAGVFFTGPVVLQGQLTIQGVGADNTLLDSEPVSLQVQALPSISDASGFTGFIGALNVDLPHLSTNTLRVGDALRMLVTFRGDPGVSRLIPPPMPRIEGWQIYPASPAEPLPQPPSTNTLAAFAYTLIPTTEEVKHTPAIPFHIFDPVRAAYVDLTIPAASITVNAEGLPTNWVAEMAALGADERVEKRPRLSDLTSSPGTTLASLQPLQARPSFFLVQFGPVAGLLVWWGWERRRRFLELHPEIVRRRKARRALRHERRVLHRAATASDATGFARSAVTALQIASAPHFPAEPRAIVCGDVLGLFAESDQRGPIGETIRRIFAQNNATDFSVAHRNGPPLFDLQTDLDRILETMEARL
jgi:hypothetical protein